MTHRQMPTNGHCLVPNKKTTLPHRVRTNCLLRATIRQVSPCCIKEAEIQTEPAEARVVMPSRGTLGCDEGLVRGAR